MLLIICFCIGCSHVTMHKGQTHIRRNCFSIYIISNKFQIGCYMLSLPREATASRAFSHPIKGEAGLRARKKEERLDMIERRGS
jgi:hypothetical protein